MAGTAAGAKKRKATMAAKKKAAAKKAPAKRKRARVKNGTYKADDPKTKKINEAYQHPATKAERMARRQKAE